MTTSVVDKDVDTFIDVFWIAYENYEAKCWVLDNVLDRESHRKWYIIFIGKLLHNTCNH